MRLLKDEISALQTILIKIKKENKIGQNVYDDDAAVDHFNKKKDIKLNKVVDKMLSSRKDEFVLSCRKDEFISSTTKDYEYSTSDIPTLLNKFIQRSDFGILIYENSMDYDIHKKNISICNRHEIRFTDIYDSDFNKDIEKLLDVGMSSGLVIMTNQTTTKYIQNLLAENGKTVDVLISFRHIEDFNVKYKVHVSFPFAEETVPLGAVEDSIFV